MSKKVTKEEVNRSLKDRGIEMIGDYSGSKVKTRFRHTCGHEWVTTTPSVVAGRGCPECAKFARYLTPEKAEKRKAEFNEKMKSREITMIGNYMGTTTKTRFKHSCGHEWVTIPTAIKVGSGCPECSKKISPERVKSNRKSAANKLKALGIMIIGEYKGIHKKTKLRHSCGHEWTAKISNVINQESPCSKCKEIQNAEKAKEMKASFNEQLKPREITIVGEYVSTHAKTRFRHSCGHEWETTAWSVIDNGTGCKKCANKKLLLNSTKAAERKAKFNEEMKDREIVMIGEYVGADKRTKFRHSCGEVWVTTPMKVRHALATGCPECSKETTPEQYEERRIKYNKLFKEENRPIHVHPPYKGATEKANLECLECGHHWDAEISRVRSKGRPHGCPACADQRLSADEINERLTQYDIELVDPDSYVNIITPVWMRHTTCGHEWKTRADATSRGRSGCPSCANSGLDPNEPAKTYYLRVEHEGTVAYKIGVTSRSVKERFSWNLDYKKITVLEEFHFATARAARELEQKVMKRYKSDKYDGPPILQTGQTEMFNRDVLGFDSMSA